MMFYSGCRYVGETPQIIDKTHTPFPGAKMFFPRKIGKHEIFTCG